MDSQQPFLRDADRGAMKRPAVAKKDDVADRLFDYQLVEKVRPLMLPAAKVHRSRQPPKGAVTAIKINAVNSVTALSERPAQTLEKSCRHAL